MFVRWQKRKKRAWRRESDPDRRGSDPDTHWDAVLIESVCIERKARQRQVVHLGSINESTIAGGPRACVHFWTMVGDRLHRLSNLTDDDRCRIVTALAEKVPLSTRAHYEQSRRPVVRRASTTAVAVVTREVALCILGRGLSGQGRSPAVSTAPELSRYAAIFFSS